MPPAPACKTLCVSWSRSFFQCKLFYNFILLLLIYIPHKKHFSTAPNFFSVDLNINRARLQFQVPNHTSRSKADTQPPHPVLSFIRREFLCKKKIGNLSSSTQNLIYETQKTFSFFGVWLIKFWKFPIKNDFSKFSTTLKCSLEGRVRPEATRWWVGLLREEIVASWFFCFFFDQAKKKRRKLETKITLVILNIFPETDLKVMRIYHE